MQYDFNRIPHSYAPFYDKSADYTTNAKNFMDALARTNKRIDVLEELFNTGQVEIPNIPTKSVQDVLTRFRHSFATFYNDQSDYTTNAQSYYDYLGRYNAILEEIENAINYLLGRHTEVEDTASVDLTITGDYDKGDEFQTIKADVKISAEPDNGLSIKPDGLYALEFDASDIWDKIDQIENEIHDINDKIVEIEGDIDNINNILDNLHTTGNAIKVITGDYNTDILGDDPVEFPLTVTTGYQGVGYLRISIYAGDDTTSGRGCFVPCSMGGSDAQTYIYTDMDNDEDVKIKIEFDTNQRRDGYLTINRCRVVNTSSLSVNKVTFNTAFAVLPL